MERSEFQRISTFDRQPQISRKKKHTKPKEKEVEFMPEVRTVALDWLELRFKQPGKLAGMDFDPAFRISENETVEHAGYTFEPTGHKSRAYSMIHKVFNESGEELGLFYSMPHNGKVFSPDTCNFKIENAWLYCDWYTELQKFVNALSLGLVAVTKIDIACDGFDFIKPVNAMLQRNIEKFGRAQFAPVLDNKGHDCYAFNIGSRTSERYIRCYEKDKEIEHSKKYYIREFWRQNHVQEWEFEFMERLEVSLKGKAIHSIWGQSTMEKLTLLQDPQFLQSTFETMRQNLYDFREITEEKNVSRAANVLQIIYKGTANVLERVKAQCTKDVRRIQSTIKTLFGLTRITGSQYYQKVCDELIFNTAMDTWYEKKKKFWQYEFDLAKKKGRAYMPILVEYKRNEQLPLHLA